MTRKIRILIADDHAIVRDGLSAILSFQNDMTVVGEADDGDAAVRKTEETHPDLVIMDLLMPLTDGAQATEEIKRRHPGTKVVILTSFGDSANVSRALSAGADGAVTKTMPKEQLIEAIRDVAAGRQMIAPEIRQSLRENEALPNLTTRQQDILHALSRGLTNKDIAKQQGLSMAGVKFHLLTIFRKLDVSNRSEAIAVALRKQLLRT